MSNTLLQAPAHLWVGPTLELQARATKEIQHLWCPNHGCQICATCRAIAHKQHAQLLWLAPDGTYRLEQFEPLFERIALATDDGMPFIFIIQQADSLPPACANRLLKIVEEPPTGYHFLFLAQRGAMVLPTIRSRCIVRTFAPGDITVEQPYTDLLAFFKQPATDGAAFLATLDRATPTELESIDLVDHLLHHWTNQALTSDHNAMAYINFLHDALRKPPMPGSSKIFWRNLFLQFSALRRAQSA